MKLSEIKIPPFIICSLVGHIPTTMIVEDDTTIHTRGCSRCGTGLGLPDVWKGVKDCPPPWIKTEAQRKAYQDEIEVRWDKLRKSI